MIAESIWNLAGLADISYVLIFWAFDNVYVSYLKHKIELILIKSNLLLIFG